MNDDDDDQDMKTVRRTIIVITHEEVPVGARALEWELAARRGTRMVHRVEYAAPGAGVDSEEHPAGEVYIIDLEITAPRASRHDLTKFVRRYLPEVEYHYITE